MAQTLVQPHAENRGIFAADLQSLSLYRILFGLVLLADFIFGFLPSRGDFYTDGGLLPRALVKSIDDNIGHISLLDLSGDAWLTELFAYGYGIALVMFIIGYHTRILKFIVFICYVSMFYRASILSMGADELMRLLSLWGLFVPLNRYWSVDSALRQRPREITVPPVFMAGIKTQVTMLYLFSGLFKVFGPEWWNGQAIGLAMRDTAYGSIFGAWLMAQAPWISLLSPVIMFFQIGFGALVYSPFFNRFTRSFAIIGAALMHIGFIFCLFVGIFPYVCLSYLVLLIPDSWFHAALQKRRARLERITLYFDPGCVFCEKTARLLQELCLSPFTRVVPASDDAAIHAVLQEHTSWVVVDGMTGATYLKWRAVAFVLRQNPFTYIFGFITDLGFMRGMFAALYDWIGRNRKTFGALTGALLPFDDHPEKPAPMAAQILCGGLILLALSCNIVNMTPFEGDVRLEFIRDAAKVMQVSQRWNLFAPSVVRNVYDFELNGITHDDKEIDIMPFIMGTHIRKGSDGRLLFDGTRWHKYFLHMLDKKKRDMADVFLQKLCANYNAAQQDEAAKLVSITFKETISFLNSNVTYRNRKRSMTCKAE